MQISERERVELALARIPSDLPRDEWWRIGAAIKHEFGDDGFDLFDTWSRGGDSYDAMAARDTWRSIDADGGIRLGSLFDLAKRHGFDPKAHPSARPHADDDAQRSASRKRASDAQAKARTSKQAAASERAATIWDGAELAPDDHPYLIQKGVSAHDLRVYRGSLKIADMPCDGALIVPLYSETGVLSSLEFIAPNGDKRFLPGGAKAGSFHVLGSDFDCIVIAEGYATAASACAAQGCAAVVAFDAGNLRRVGDVMHKRYPDADLVFAVDNDVSESGRNTGLDAATAAAKSVGGMLAIPPEGMDLNDLQRAQGIEAVRDLIVAALPDQWPTSMEERPSWGVYSRWQVIDGVSRKPGVWRHTYKQRDGQDPVLVDEWISSPLYVVATTSNREDDDYGFLLRYVSRRGIWKYWAMPAEMLAGDGSEAIGVLMAGGVEIAQNKRREVLNYISAQHPKRHMRAATLTGWHDGAFVLPDEVIGADDVWFQAATRTAPYGVAGTLAGWRTGVAALANGNPLLMLAIASAFAGVLLDPLRIDGAGLHIYGDSSTGKTTALVAGISVWGGQSFRRQWRATANGLEGAGTMHTDTLLALDEIGEVAPRDLYEASYALANGTGKSRANKHGEARKAAQWRVFVLSTGETTIIARIEAGGIEAKAGQALRILDLPVNGRYGLFDDLRGLDSGARLSDALRDAAARHYGHAGRMFARKMTEIRAQGVELNARLQDVLARFDAPDGQERRAARVLALTALAGELAIEFGIVDWTPGAPTEAARRSFKGWQDRRETNGHSAEHTGVMRAVSAFIDRCGDARFSDIDADGSPLMPIRDRAGYWRMREGERAFLFTAEGLREATKGYDFNRALAALEQAGAISRAKDGQRSTLIRVPGGHRTRLYAIDPRKLDTA
ncbi:DUF927 domain-containing protein [Burkholderia metallica]|uniref:DUF927 domain-containing protein n=1 Tax=Burkholderia metallica TaxID=488729 RepID=UPI00157A2194|nr:DUF927 domain-containing protein [Burkholderia metallica]NTZ86241.1 DUF927 domain-containing protein [Burkholderia metallica]